MNITLLCNTLSTLRICRLKQALANVIIQSYLQSLQCKACREFNFNLSNEKDQWEAFSSLVKVMLKQEHEARLQITQDMQSRAVGTCVGQLGNSPLILASVEAKPKTSKSLGLLLALQGFQTFLRPCRGLELYLDRPFPLGLSDGCTYIAYPTTCTCCLQAKVS